MNVLGGGRGRGRLVGLKERRKLNRDFTIRPEIATDVQDQVVRAEGSVFKHACHFADFFNRLFSVAQ